MALIFQIFYILSIWIQDCLIVFTFKNIYSKTNRFEDAQRQICWRFKSFYLDWIFLSTWGGKKTTIHNKKAHFCSFVFSPAALLNYPLVPAVERISGCFRVEGQPRSSQRSGPLVLDFGPTESSYRVRVPFTSTHLTSAQHTPCLKGLPSGSRHRSVPRRKVVNNEDEAHVVYCALSPSKL